MQCGDTTQGSECLKCSGIKEERSKARTLFSIFMNKNRATVYKSSVRRRKEFFLKSRNQ